MTYTSAPRIWPQRANHLRLHQRHLLVQVGRAVGNFLGPRQAVVRGATLDDVRNEDVFASQIDRRQQPIQHPAGGPTSTRTDARQRWRNSAQQPAGYRLVLEAGDRARTMTRQRIAGEWWTAPDKPMKVTRAGITAFPDVMSLQPARQPATYLGALGSARRTQDCGPMHSNWNVSFHDATQMPRRQ